MERRPVRGRGLPDGGQPAERRRGRQGRAPAATCRRRAQRRGAAPGRLQRRRDPGAARQRGRRVASLAAQPARRRCGPVTAAARGLVSRRAPWVTGSCCAAGARRTRWRSTRLRDTQRGAGGGRCPDGSGAPAHRRPRDVDMPGPSTRSGQIATAVDVTVPWSERAHDRAVKRQPPGRQRRVDGLVVCGSPSLRQEDRGGA
jgi:hypothetical protein